MTTSFCANPNCGHANDGHVDNGPCIIPGCPCYSFVSSDYVELTKEIAKARKTKARPYDTLAVCYVCGRLGCSVPKCPYMQTAKKLGTT